MITAIEIESFKCVDDRVRVELAPITLLFGPNSAGKSTIIQALLYAHEILSRRNPDAGETVKGGRAVDLGGFLSLVHEHDPMRRVGLAIELDVDGLLPDPGYLGDAFYSDPWGIGGSASTARLELEIRWSPPLGRPLVRRFGIGLDGVPFGAIEASEDGARVSITELNLRHPLVLDEDEPETGAFESAVREALGPTEMLDDGRFQIAVDVQRSALPPLDAQLVLGGAWDDPEAAEDPDVIEVLDQIRGTLSHVFVGVGILVRDELERLRYLGPLRDVPPRGYLPPRYADDARWATGLAAWDALWKGDASFVHEVSDWLSSDERLDTGLEIRRSLVKRLDTAHPTMLALTSGRVVDDVEDLRRELDRMPEEVRLVLVETQRQHVELLPHDVGTGISQVLPVAVAALAEGARTVCIEQPELHVHPRVQVSLGDLFIAQAAKPDRQLVLETHSEHLLLRMMRRVRETGAGTLPPGKAPLRPEHLSVNIIENDPRGMTVRRLEVDDEGEFLGPWPGGFFDEREPELL